MSKLDEFAEHAKDVKSRADLCKAIDKVGTLPRYHERGVFKGTVFATPSGVIKLTEPAEQEAKELYEYVRDIATNLRDKPLPKYETNPFEGIRTMKEWCLLERTQDAADNDDNDKLSEDKQNIVKIDSIDEKLIELSQEYERKKENKPGLKFPSSRAIEKKLEGTNLETSHTTIAGRLKRLRDADLIPKTTKNKERAYDPTVIVDKVDDGRASQLKPTE